MSNDTVAVIAISGALAGAVGVCGLIVAFFVRRRSLRWAFVAVAVSGVMGFMAGVVGTARAMFLSDHDFGVVLVVSLVAGIVSLGFAVAVSGLTVRGARAVQEAARRLGDDGDYVAPDNVALELAALSGQLSETSSKLAASRDRERMIEASRRELVAWVSHDLRTPLAGLRAMAEALEDGMVDDPSRYHRQMRETVDRMARLVDDLFELSRIHAGSLNLSVMWVPLEDVISEVLAVSGPVALAQGVELGGYAEPGVAVCADPRELARLIGNLVTNAIRHTPSEGTVQVSGHAKGDAVELVVSDACGGIPEEDLDRVFEVAWRGSHARTPGHDAGSGLGLAIVRGIAEAHDGSVSVRNEGPGCSFAVRLPN